MPSLLSEARPAPDALLADLADYAVNYKVASESALDLARWCLADTLAGAIQALADPACTRLLGPVVPRTTIVHGSRVPGTSYELDPVQAAFSIGAAAGWLGLNDTWIAVEESHPSDNLGAILAVADWISRQERLGLQPSAFHTALALGKGAPGRPPLLMRDVLAAMVKAHEIQGVLALENAFARVGLDHVLLVRVASTAIATALLGGTREQTINALSHAWLDGSALRLYRQSPHTGPRQSWAAGEATSRAVRLAFTAMTGEPGHPAALTAKTWGFEDVFFRGNAVKLGRPLGAFVMEHTLFHVAFPGDLHAHTAIEAAIKLHSQARNRLDQIERVELFTHEPALRMLDRSGPLASSADRRQCLQYLAAAALIFGEVTPLHCEDAVARDPRLDALRARIVVAESKAFSKDHLDPAKRSLASAVRLIFKDGTKTEKTAVEYPAGHDRRRAEGLPLLQKKAQAAFATHFGEATARQLMALFTDRARLEALPVHAFCQMFSPAAESSAFGAQPKL